MGKLNTVDCIGTNLNTGVAGCPVHFSIEGAIEVPKDRFFTDAEIDAMQATLNSGVKALNRKDRFYPFPVLTGDDLQGGDPVVVDFDNGQEITTWENHYKLTCKFYKGGIPANNALRSRNGNDVSFLFYGKIGNSFAVVGSYVNGAKKGVPSLNFWCGAQKWGAFKRESQYAWKASVPVPYMNEFMWYLPVDFNPQDIEGLHHVELSTASVPVISVGGVADFYVKEKGYGTDYATNYAAELGAIALVKFTAKNASTGLTIPVTARAVANGKLTYTLDTASPNYPAANGKIIIIPPTVADLEAGNIPSTEIQELVITRP